MIKRILTQMIRDKRTLALMFIAPVFILTLMYYLFNGDTSIPTLGVVNVDNSIVSALRDNGVDVIEYTTVDDKTIADDDLGGLLQVKDNKLSLILQNSDTSISKALEMKINGVLTTETIQKAFAMAGIKPSAITSSLNVTYLYGNSDTNFFDILSPILIGFFVFFFVFIISGIGLLRERTTGTLEKLVSTPIKRWEIVSGYLIGFGIFAVIQTFVVVLFSINILDIVIVGSIWNVILINLLTAFVALSLGILLSTFASSEFQMIQFIPLIIVPQIFFAGIIPVTSMANWLQIIAKFMPMYYVGDALTGIMYKGYGLGDIRTNITVLCVFAIVFVVLNVLALKKYRKL